MRRKVPVRAVLTALAVASVLRAAPADRPKLPETYRKWVEEEVAYIITPVERGVFLKLGSDRERDLFIEAFWKHRDPTPESAGNEFKTEHYRRTAHADQYFGRDAPVPGWKTDRGRMYILLGEPGEVQRFTGRSSLYDCEAWFYQGMADKGLPPAFYLLFFREHGQGMYKLYSPVQDGPQALLPAYSGSPGDYERAYQALRAVDPGLAGIAMNLVPGESAGSLGRPSMASDLLVQRIEAMPVRTVQESYARKFLEYKDLVEVEYSANYLDSDSLVKVFREPSGRYFVHYAIEPQRLSVNQHGGKMYTTLKVNGRVTTLDGRPVYQYDKTVPVDMAEARMAELGRAPFDLHDIIPLVAGDFRLSVLVKNEVSKEFMSVEQAVRIPAAGPGVRLTQPLLGYRVDRLAAPERKAKPFRVGPYQVYCQPGRIFTAGDTLALVFQVHGLSAGSSAAGQVRIAFLKDGAPFREIVRRPSEFSGLPDCLEEVPLAGFPPAHYKITISVLDAGAEVVSAGEEFDLTFAPSVGRPWSLSRVLPEPGDPFYGQIAGTQLFNLGRYPEARTELELAYGGKPDSPDIAYGLARVCLAQSDHQRAVQVLQPFVDRAERAPYEVYVLAAEACRRSGDFARAIAVLDKAVSHYGVNASLLNASGESYLGLGKAAEALAAFERSLQLSPDQPEVRKRVDELKRRK